MELKSNKSLIVSDKRILLLTISKKKRTEDLYLCLLKNVKTGDIIGGNVYMSEIGKDE